MASTPLLVNAGNYQLEEVTAPNGYVLNDEPVPFKITNQGAVELDPDGDPVFKVEFFDTSVKGKIKITKTNHESQPLDRAIFNIIAAEDIMDPSNDGSIIYSSGTIVQTLSTVDGKVESEELPLGKYVVDEILAPDNHVLSSTKYEVDLKYENQTINIVISEIDVINKQVEIIKANNVGTPIIGATLQIVSNKTKEIIDQWVTDGTPHYPSSLVEGQSYVLRELSAPDGYIQSEDVIFTVTDNKDTQQIIMTDKQINIEKHDIDGQPLIGALMQILDQDNQIIDEWTTDGQPYFPSGLKENQTYTLREIAAPDRYILSEDITFIVTNTKETQNIIMIDKQINIEKLDTDGQPLIGAQMQIFDQDNQIIDEWTTDGKPYFPNGLKENQTYTLREIVAPDGYIFSKDITFTVTNIKETQNIIMTDKQLKIKKVDIDNQPVIGATLQIVSTKTKQIVDQWVSDGTPYYPSGLMEGQSYVLRELSAPDGYIIAEDIEFVVSDKKVNQEIIMIDDYTKIEINKLDQLNGSFVEGATLQIVSNKTKQIVDQWVTTDEPCVFYKIPAGDYILQEVDEPSGYYKAEDIHFTIEEHGEKQTITMFDTPILTDIQVNKVDSITNKAIISKDFEFTIYKDKACTDKIMTVNANTEDGTATFKDLRYGSYYIKETKAPTGYFLSDEVKEVIVNDELENVGEIYSFVYLNEMMPIISIKTGDPLENKPYLIALIGSALLLILLRKKEDKAN